MKNMESIYREQLNELITRYPALEECSEEIWNAFQMLRECFKEKGKLLIAGNGGSAADADHIVGELMKGFKSSRSIPKEMCHSLKAIDCENGKLLSERLQGALPAIALNNHTALSTAYLNDVDGDFTYAQQTYGYGVKGDVFFGITTSGNSRNIILAATVAKAKGLKVIALTGESGGKISNLADVSIKVPSREAYTVQELHLPVYHCLCLMLEKTFFS